MSLYNGLLALVWNKVLYCIASRNKLVWTTWKKCIIELGYHCKNIVR